MAVASKIRDRSKSKYRHLKSEEDQKSLRPKEVRGDRAPKQKVSSCPEGPFRGKQRCSKKVHVSPLPDRYEPLQEEVEDTESKEVKKSRRKQKVKKYARISALISRYTPSRLLRSAQGCVLSTPLYLKPSPALNLYHRLPPTSGIPFPSISD
ncbi:required for drug-induced death protein 1 isoform X1 [Ascaphus truei]|uniref:required for drug-induced death protein 1 isoform X1 n=1 Tax=Ascaphus truei TaxID=8439 RepID=UPI003F5AA15C